MGFVRKLVILLVLISVFTLLLAEKVEIVFWHNMSNPVDKKSIEESVQKFNETHPNIHVKVVLVPGSETEITKLMTAVAAGTGPDVYYLDRFTVAQRAYQGVLECIEDYLVQLGVDVEALKQKFFKFAIEEATYNGKLYALPWDTDVRVLYYNKKLFREAGLDPDKPPVTIEELDEYAEKLTKMKGNRIEQLGFIPWFGQGWHYTWGWAFGGKFYDPKTQKLVFAEDPKIIESFKWQKKYADKYGMKNIGAFASAYSGANLNPFLAGKLAMVVDGNWFLAQIRTFAPKDFEYGIAPIPYPPYGEANSTWAGGWSLVIPKGAKHPKEAAEFILYMATEGQIKYAIDTAHLPTYKAGVPELIKKDPMQKHFAELLPTAHCRPVIPVGALLWDKLTEARDYILYGQKTVEQALKDAEEEVQKELDKALGK
ncbi:MAG: ABC transporter substrate-binding protein [Thermotoga sp.]|nr:MAG: ABC transporter substrate-binding protein [Thermotoga sp.]HDM69847.1 ABC transporter substrate-binding protein [Thermotogales bacterium]